MPACVCAMYLHCMTVCILRVCDCVCTCVAVCTCLHLCDCLCVCMCVRVHMVPSTGLPLLLLWPRSLPGAGLGQGGSRRGRRTEAPTLPSVPRAPWCFHSSPQLRAWGPGKGALTPCYVTPTPWPLPSSLMASPCPRPLEFLQIFFKSPLMAPS